ncbi:MAG: D-galactarate dehydratase [Planctomycetaceae bacterium]|nr:MAG: D-galactarate dehydratase [Planctomycetaceae bacterium]
MQHSDFVVLNPADNVAVAVRELVAGTELPGGRGMTREYIERGHKVALTDISSGEAIRKYGQVIGYASMYIPQGSWVHVHNVQVGELRLDYEMCTAVPPDPPLLTNRTFMGYKRKDGRVATRNYIGIISTVNCSATTARYVAQHFDKELLADYPNVDGVVALVHKGGCGFQYGGPSHRQLSRTLAGFARHPNIGAYVILGLGCETGHAGFLVEQEELVSLQDRWQPPQIEQPLVINIQEEGGVAKTVRRVTAQLKEWLPEINRVQREPVPVSELMLGLECGGSDGYSGITANPALGICSDLLVAHGGTAVLSETTEIYGGEHLLTRRAVTRDVAEKLLERIQWWIHYTGMFGERIDINPSVGNKKGGLTTIYEKSLGAIAKAGSTALKAVYEYAEPIKSKGLVIMDTPGYDPASVTGMVAGGCQVVCFTTGRGSCFGCKPVPTIKISTNSALYNRMKDDMDIDAGKVLAGVPIEVVGREIFEEVIAVASGKKTKSESQGIGDEEFCPWMWGPVT